MAKQGGRKAFKGKRRFRKRSFRRKSKKVVISKDMVNMGLGFPKKCITTMRWVINPQITSTTGVMTNFRVSANAISPPVASSHNAMYFANYDAIYDHWTVIGSKCKLTVTTSTTLPFVCGVFVNDDTSTAPTTLEGIEEQSSSNSRVITQYADPVYFTTKWSAKKWFGGSVLGNDRLQGAGTTLPAEQSFYNFFIKGFGTTDTVTASVKFEVDFIVVWDELKDQNFN